jgi:hypothetical protein
MNSKVSVQPFDLWVWVVLEASLGHVVSKDDRPKMGLEEDYWPE